MVDIATGFQTVIQNINIVKEGRMVVTAKDSDLAKEQEKTSANIIWSTLL